ncbi:MAG: phosphatidate cytidylyltransferase [Bacteroidetes bacterium]|nr:phosphatidate cytidylyltransferase [Rhodothermia bacterium]MCS7154759.1 phosphatidate cytidylyltransferase [Bacteroidota bacterium]MCX7907084.1 phosphatidate cytidylyltransferase [Bacteroidota bacterium]MDW8137552.1 phosphatidate cytidylyltransferase [Bacteroidota bacterium]MDW8285494.1 phosphatidate cytidylyltransferase [Bacteroidota bacterium]
MKAELPQRLLVGLGLAPIVLAVVYVGGWLFWAALALVGALAVREWNALLRHEGVHPNGPLSLPLGAFLAAREAWPGLWPWGLAVGVLALLLAEPLRGRGRPLGNVSASLAGPLYAPFLIGFLGVFRRAEGAPEGWAWVMGLLLLVWAADTGAWMGGRLWGRHPLAPRISPGKTWEGLWSGALLTALVALLLGFTLWHKLAGIHVAVLAAIAAFGGPMGDLAESWLKRGVGVKDSGQLLPGHGGILDRIDALAPVSTLAAFYAHAVGLL